MTLLIDLITKDFANPLVAEHLHFYPEETDGPVTEVWQCSRWKEMPLHLLSPMFARGSTHFYVNELAQRTNMAFVLPVMWVTRKGALHADAYEVIEVEVS